MKERSSQVALFALKGQRPPAESRRKETAARRLESWKLIADYLGRSTRTIQRWHEQYGLPIRRLGGDRGTVYAYSDELDGWLRARGHVLGPDAGPVVFTDRRERQRRRADHFAQLVAGEAGLKESAAIRSASAELVARAAEMWRNFTWGNLRMVLRLYRDAIDLDVGNAEAHAGLAVGLMVQALMGGIRSPVAYRAAGAALETAERADLNRVMLRVARSLLDILTHRNWERAGRELDEVIAENPKMTRAYGTRAMLRIAEGDLESGASDLGQVLLVSPLSLSAWPFRAWCDYLKGDSGQALFLIQQALATGRHGPFCDALEALALIQLGEWEAHAERLEEVARFTHNHDVLLGSLAWMHVAAGQREKAKAILRYLQPDGELDTSHEPYAVALALLGLGDHAGAVRRLEQAWQEGSVWSLAFRSDPMLKPLRGLPEFEEFLTKLDLPVARLGQ